MHDWSIAEQDEFTVTVDEMMNKQLPTSHRLVYQVVDDLKTVKIIRMWVLNPDRW